jgi:hypothetical protein
MVWWGEWLRFTSTQWVDANAWVTSTNAFAKTPTLYDPKQSWKTFFGKLSLYLIYNLYHPDLFYKNSIYLCILAILVSWEIEALTIK